MGVSLRQIEDLLGVLLPPETVPDHSTLGRWVQDAGERAGAALEVLDPACAGRVEKVRGQAIATNAHQTDAAKVDAAIRQLAATGREFSSNEARGLHGVVGPVVGARFTAARKAGLIRAVGFTESTSESTHAHPVRTWVGVAA